MERAHVPSVSQRAFSKPMSPQALQAHRTHGRPASQTFDGRPQEDEYDEDQSQTYTELSGMPSTNARPQYVPDGKSSRCLVDGRLMVEIVPLPTTPSSQAPLSRTTGFRKSIRASDNPLHKAQGASPTASLQPPATPRSGYRFPGEKATSVYDGLDDGITLAAEPASSRDKNYQHFQAGRIFLFNGFLQTAKDRPFILVTLIAILIPTALFFAFPGRLLWIQVSGGPAVTIIFALIFLHCMLAMVHACFSDPGIIPHNLDRNPPLKPDADPLSLGPPQERWVAVPSPMAKMGAFEVPCKFCKTCCVWRPPRCYHCGICNTCVDTLDHHCVWLNNCIGRRNYVHFLTFLSSLICLSLYMSAASIGQLAAIPGVSFGTAINQNRVSFALFIYGILGFCYPAALLGYHVFLMARGETTREYLNNRKRPAAERFRPFSTGSVFRNLVSTICKPVPPINVDFAHAYVPGDQRFEKMS